MRRVAVALSLAALALAGCGSASGGREASSVPEASTRTPTAAEPHVRPAERARGGDRPVVAGETGVTPAKRPRAVDLTVAASGDLLIHSPVWSAARAFAGGDGYDFRPMLRLIRPYIRGADLALCHVETPLAPGALHGYPVFNGPPDLAKAIRWAGWDACDTASNHSLDGGQAGIDATGRTLDRLRIPHTGSARSAAAARKIVLLRAKGVKVAFLAYTAVSNGQIAPHRWSVNRAEPKRILADARRARRKGADVVIVNVHWGDENVVAPSQAQEALARTLTASRDVTAVVGQHVHVVQPIRRVGRKLVVFGEGNLLSNQTPACCAPGSQDGIIALLRLRVAGGRARLTRVDYVPTWVRHPDFTVVPVGSALRRGLEPAAELRASWKRTTGVIGKTRLYAPWVRARP